MYEVSLKTDGNWEKILKKMESMGEDAVQAANIALTRAVTMVRTAVLSSGLVPFKTGTLRRSITTSVFGRQLEDMKGQIGSNLKYAPVHEFGGAWTFVRDTVFGRKVKPFTVTAHYQERAYLRTPFDQAQPEIQRIFTEELAKVVKFA